MRTELACLPCFFSQISRTLSHGGVQNGVARSVRNKAEQIIERSSLDQAPARISTLIHRLIREETGIDPYRSVKREYNRIALGLLPELRGLALQAADPLEGGVRAAIAGNIIDFGIYDRIDLNKSIGESFELPLRHDQFQSFRRAVEQADSILYLFDNAGEIVFDRVLLETLMALRKTVTVAVKGAPVINDATRQDADEAGLREYTHLIDNGNDGIGTILELCSPRFMDAYHSADMIISKGQANFETLAGTGDKRLFFLFKVKCPVVAQFLSRENGDLVLMQGREDQVPVES